MKEVSPLSLNIRPLKQNTLQKRIFCFTVGALGVEPRSQDPQPCIMAVILRPGELYLFSGLYAFSAGLYSFA